MGKRKLIPIAIIIFIFSAFAIYKFCFSAKINNEPDPNISPPEITQPVQAAKPNKQDKKEKPKKQGYVIKDYGGNIAVFEDNETKPFRITDIEVKNLPEADRKELKNGITAQNNEQLTTLLEDYLS